MLKLDFFLMFNLYLFIFKLVDELLFFNFSKFLEFLINFVFKILRCDIWVVMIFLLEDILLFLKFEVIMVVVWVFFIKIIGLKLFEKL